MNPYREMNAPELVRQWKKIVNDNVLMGRDAKLLKNTIDLGITPAQILLGMYLVSGSETVTIPQFLRQQAQWLVEDELWAEIELARWVSSNTPSAYYVYSDLYDERDAWAFHNAQKARRELKEWADKVLG